MATYTANYGLHQWVPEDNFQRTDFNEDLQKIDMAMAALEADKAEQTALQSTNEALTALANQVNISAGTYTGDGATSKYISLSFQPKAVLVEHRNGLRHEDSKVAAEGGLAVTGSPLRSSSSSWDVNALRISGSGFYVSGAMGSNLNTASQVYHYVVFR